MDEFNLNFVIIFILFILSIPILIAFSCVIYNIYNMFLHTEKNTPREYESGIGNIDPCLVD